MPLQALRSSNQHQSQRLQTDMVEKEKQTHVRALSCSLHGLKWTQTLQVIPWGRRCHLYTCIYIYTYIYISIYNLHICIYVNLYMHVCLILICICTYIYILYMANNCSLRPMSAAGASSASKMSARESCLYVCVKICIYTHTYICINTHTYIHTYIQLLSALVA